MPRTAWTVNKKLNALPGASRCAATSTPSSASACWRSPTAARCTAPWKAIRASLPSWSSDAGRSVGIAVPAACLAALPTRRRLLQQPRYQFFIRQVTLDLFTVAFDQCRRALDTDPIAGAVAPFDYGRLGAVAGRQSREIIVLGVRKRLVSV